MSNRNITGGNKMNSFQIREQINKNNAEINQGFQPQTFVLNTRIAELIQENKKLREEWEFSFRTELAHHRVAEKELQEKIREQQATIIKQDEEIKKLKRTERSWRRIHCCNKESDNCGIVNNQESKIKLLEKENNDLRQQRDYYEKICTEEGLI